MHTYYMNFASLLLLLHIFDVMDMIKSSLLLSENYFIKRSTLCGCDPLIIPLSLKSKNFVLLTL